MTDTRASNQWEHELRRVILGFVWLSLAGLLIALVGAGVFVGFYVDDGYTDAPFQARGIASYGFMAVVAGGGAFVAAALIAAALRVVGALVRWRRR